MRQIECDEWGVVKVNLNRVKLFGVVKKKDEAPKHEEDDNEEQGSGEETGGPKAWDDITGVRLETKAVKDARRDEIRYVEKHCVYRKVKRSSVPAGAKIIQVRWIDINKGDESKPDIRSRLVAKDFKADD